MSKTTKSNRNSGNKKIAAAVGLGLASAAAAAGAYYFFGKDGAKHRRDVKHWSVKAKKEVLVQVKKLKEVNQQRYEKVINEVMDRYQKLKNVDPKEVAATVSELRGYWRNISKAISATKRVAPKSRSNRGGRKTVTSK